MSLNNQTKVIGLIGSACAITWILNFSEDSKGKPFLNESISDLIGGIALISLAGLVVITANTKNIEK